MAQSSLQTAQNQRSRKGRATQTEAQRTPASTGPTTLGGANLAATLADVGGASPAEVIALQRMAGNRAVQRLIARHQLQGKLNVGPANDVYEQEADRVADKVMRSPARPVRQTPAATQASTPTQASASLSAEGHSSQSHSSGSHSSVSRSVESHSASSQPSHASSTSTPTISPLAQRAPGEMEEMGEGFEAGADVEHQLSAMAGQGDPLPNKTKSQMEAGFGTDFSAVRIHADSQAGQLSRKINAQAFTHGSDIYFGSGKYNPGTTSGGHLLAHELTHVVQQTGGTLRRAQQRARTNKAPTKPALHSPAAATQQTSDNSVQRKLLIGGRAANASIAEGQNLREMQLNLLRDMVENNVIKYKFASAENLFTYLRKPTRNDLVEIEQPEMTDDKPSTGKTAAKAIGGGLLGLILSPLTATIGGLAGLVRGGASGAKSVYNKIGRGRGGGMKFLAGLLAIGGAIVGAIRGAITGALGGFLAGPVGGALAAAPELAEEDPEKTRDVPKIKRQAILPGDILLVRGGGGVGGGIIAVGQYLHQLWSGKSRAAGTGFRHAGVAIDKDLWAHASGGVFKDPITSGLHVYRNKNRKLAKQAADVANEWGVAQGNIASVGYSKAKAGESLFRSSSYSSTRAAVLAMYFEQGITPGAMFCSEFAISVYQAAALLPAIRELKSDLPDTQDKGEIKDWAKSHREEINNRATNNGAQASPTGDLPVDPRRTGPQMLAAELHRQSQGDDPTWEYKGIIDT